MRKALIAVRKRGKAETWRCSYVALWIFLSATVIMYNKWVLSFSGFPYPVALTLWHMFFCSALAFGVVKLGYVETINMSSETYFK